MSDVATTSINNLLKECCEVIHFSNFYFIALAVVAVVVGGGR